MNLAVALGAIAVKSPLQCRISADITQLYKARGYSLSRAFVPPQDIPGVGRFSIVSDPQGAVLGARTEATLRVQNATDVRYATGGWMDYDEIGNYGPLLLPAAPRNWTVALRVDW